MIKQKVDVFLTLTTENELGAKSSATNSSDPLPKDIHNAFLQEHGRALAAWALTEYALISILSTCIAPKNDHVFREIFDSISSARTKLDLCEAAVCAATQDADVLDAWKKLRHKYTKKMKKRNVLAHGATYYDPAAKADSRKFFISVSPTNAQKDQRLYVSDINDVTSGFIRLLQQCLTFSNILARQLGSPRR